MNEFDIKIALESMDEAYLECYQSIVKDSSTPMTVYIANTIFTKFLNHDLLVEQIDELKKCHERELADLDYRYIKEISSLIDELTTRKNVATQSIKSAYGYSNVTVAMKIISQNS